MHVFVGLGNPGNHYQYHRHNVGFMVIDGFAEKYHLSFKNSHQGMVAVLRLDSNKNETQQILLYKPMLYMNKSGDALQQLCKFYQLQETDITVFHDDIELPIETLRIKTGGGNAGHNGLKNISTMIGNNYQRIRIGVSRPIHGDVHHHVLSNFYHEEYEKIKKIIDFLNQYANDIVQKNTQYILQEYNKL